MISATGRLLRRQGYAATGLNQVMSEADAPKGSMYFHFPGGKEELAAAAVDRFAERITAKMTDLLARRSVADAIVGFFDSYIEYFERTEYRDGCVVATVALDEAGTHELLADAASTRVAHLGRSAVRRARSRGSVDRRGAHASPRSSSRPSRARS